MQFATEGLTCVELGEGKRNISGQKKTIYSAVFKSKIQMKCDIS